MHTPEVTPAVFGNYCWTRREINSTVISPITPEIRGDIKHYSGDHLSRGNGWKRLAGFFCDHLFCRKIILMLLRVETIIALTFEPAPLFYFILHFPEHFFSSMCQRMVCQCQWVFQWLRLETLICGCFYDEFVWPLRITNVCVCGVCVCVCGVCVCVVCVWWCVVRVRECIQMCVYVCVGVWVIAHSMLN